LLQLKSATQQALNRITAAGPQKLKMKNKKLVEIARLGSQKKPPIKIGGTTKNTRFTCP